jgi:hypothetical protein
MRLYIIRHAEPDYERNSITARGHKEARALAKSLKKEGLTRIYSSPLGRAIHTAEYTAKATGLRIRVEEWTRELSDLKMGIVPPWGPLMVWDLPGEIIRRKREHLNHERWHRIPLFGQKKFRAEIIRVQKNSDNF